MGKNVDGVENVTDTEWKSYDQIDWPGTPITLEPSTFKLWIPYVNVSGSNVLRLAQGWALVTYNIAYLCSTVFKNPKIAAKWCASQGVFVALQ